MSRSFVLGIVALALVLRTVGLAHLPAGFTPDEASFGYDAYSLLHTGKDQWGNPFPTTFKSFGDYKLPVYTYLVMPSVKFLGLNPFAVRLPNALLGTLAVLFTYLLVCELLEEKHRSDKTIPLLASFLLAISYWHISLSRGAFEANLTTFFMTAGAYFFLKARQKNWYLSLSMLLFGINLFTYHAARLVTPLIVISLLWIYRSSFPVRKRYGLASAIFLFFFLSSIISLLAGSGIRASTSTILSQNLGSGAMRASVVTGGMPLPLARAFFNEPTFKISKIIQNYISYFSPDFLLTQGARESSYGMILGSGVLSLVEYSGIILFVWVVIKHKKTAFMFLLIWILAAPIPAAISVGPGNAANRAAILMPALQMAAAFGLVYGISKLRIKFRETALSGVFVFSLLLSLVSITKYVYEQPVYSGTGMMYGMEELFSFLKEYPTKHILLSRSLSEPHIFAAFYDPIYPNLYQKATTSWNYQAKGLSWVDQQEGYFVGRYVISSIDPVRDFYLENTFIVGTPVDMPWNARIVKTIYTPDRKPLWVVAEKQ